MWLDSLFPVTAMAMTVATVVTLPPVVFVVSKVVALVVASVIAVAFFAPIIAFVFTAIVPAVITTMAAPVAVPLFGAVVGLLVVVVASDTAPDGGARSAAKACAQHGTIAPPGGLAHRSPSGTTYGAANNRTVLTWAARGDCGAGGTA